MQLTFLVIDDDDSNLELLVTIIESEGGRVISAKSGHEGLQKAEQEKPDIILLDIGLPDISGIEVLECLRKNVNLTSIPVVAVTAYATEKEQALFEKSGFDEIVIKPIIISDFIAMIQGIVNRHLPS